MGIHSPIHYFCVYLAWVKLYGVPSPKEAFCILIHDIGYYRQDVMDGPSDFHPILGAKIAYRLFGKKYYDLCIAHSRDYAKKNNLPLSKLGYADKYWLFYVPNPLYNFIIHAGGEAQHYERTTKTKKWGIPIDVKLIKWDYQRWWEKNAIQESSTGS